MEYESKTCESIHINDCLRPNSISRSMLGITVIKLLSSSNLYSLLIASSNFTSFDFFQKLLLFMSLNYWSSKTEFRYISILAFSPLMWHNYIWWPLEFSPSFANIIYRLSITPFLDSIHPIFLKLFIFDWEILDSLLTLWIYPFFFELTTSNI